MEAIGWRRQREPHRDRENWAWSEKSLFVRLALFDLLCIHNTYTYLEHLIATDRFKLALYQLIQLIVGFGMMDDCSGNSTVISQHIKRLLYDLMISIDYIACRYFSFWLMVLLLLLLLLLFLLLLPLLFWLLWRLRPAVCMCSLPAHVSHMAITCIELQSNTRITRISLWWVLIKISVGWKGNANFYWRNCSYRAFLCFSYFSQFLYPRNLHADKHSNLVWPDSATSKSMSLRQMDDLNICAVPWISAIFGWLNATLAERVFSLGLLSIYASDCIIGSFNRKQRRATHTHTYIYTSTLHAHSAQSRSVWKYFVPFQKVSIFPIQIHRYRCIVQLFSRIKIPIL